MLDTENLKTIPPVTLSYLGGVKCFTEGGVTVFAGASGSGKSVYLGEYTKKLANEYKNIYYFNYDESPMGVTTFSPVTFSDLQKSVLNSCSDDVVIIDTLKAYTAYNNLDVDSSEDMYKMMTDFTALARGTGVSIILVHHVDAEENLEGADAIFEGADEVTIFERREETGMMYGYIKKQRFDFECESCVTLS